MKRLTPLVFAFLMSTYPALAWGWGNCPNSKKDLQEERTNQNVRTFKDSEKKDK